MRVSYALASKARCYPRIWSHTRLQRQSDTLPACSSGPPPSPQGLRHWPTGPSCPPEVSACPAHLDHEPQGWAICSPQPSGCLSQWSCFVKIPFPLGPFITLPYVCLMHNKMFLLESIFWWPLENLYTPVTATKTKTQNIYTTRKRSLVPPLVNPSLCSWFLSATDLLSDTVAEICLFKSIR